MHESQAALYINYTDQKYSIGLAVVEPYGLRGWISEVTSDPSHPYGAIDQILHLLFVTGSRKLIIGASSRPAFEEIATNFSMYEYRYDERKFDGIEQNSLFQEVFGIHSLLTPIEHLDLETRPFSAQALALLASELKGFGLIPCALPVLLDTAHFMELGNNALEQLEMISVDKRAPSIAKLFLNMVTPMGKRLGRFRLFLPITKERELNRRFDWIEAVSPHSHRLEEELRQIGDFELFWWQFQRADEENLENLHRCVHRIIEIQRYCRQHRFAHIIDMPDLLDDWEKELKNNSKNRQWKESQILFVREIVDWIAQLDVAVSSAITAQKLALCRPMIVTTTGQNFLQMMGLRHLLVEAQGISYVPNDIVMGDRDYLDLPYPSTVMLDSRVHDGENIRGVLLYGINSSGKSSLMKSVGIAVVLAQAGFFVPSKGMKLSLFDGVYTRIQSRDNVAKSLSTFGVEMLELNAVFNRATEKSLIIGDEISHGTETLSAVSIVASTIIELSQKGSLFLMTTHLHQLSMITELSKLRPVVSLHLSVRYDENCDRLIYDRLLKPGRGSSVYGLEFAESLHMSPRFLENAKRLRENLAKEYDVLELGHQKEYIKRYRDIVACECVVCGALIRNNRKFASAKEHHHLIALCETHSRQIAEGKINVRGFIMTPQGLRLEYEKLLE